jgi:hypothetical protein
MFLSESGFREHQKINYPKIECGLRWANPINVKVGIGLQHIVPAMATVVHEVGKKLKIEGKSEELRDALGKTCLYD